MDLDRPLHLYYDFTGGGAYEGAVKEHFESGGFDRMEERGEIRFFLDETATARAIYARFAGCDTVNGNDAILSALHEVMNGGRIRFAAEEGNYFVSGTDLGATADLSRTGETSRAYDLGCSDLDDDALTKAIGRSRFAILRLGTPEGTDYVAINDDGSSHAWSGDWADGNGTVEIVRALDEAGALPDAVRDLMGDAARQSLDAEHAPVPGP